MSADPRPSVREEQKKLTRDRLLDAAAQVFTEKSVFDASMDDIAKAANVARVTVYAHFPGKTEIVMALSERLFAGADQVYAELAAMPRWTRATIRQWLEAFADKWREHAVSVRALTMAGPALASRGSSSAHDRYVTMLTADRERWHAVDQPQARQRVLMMLGQIESFFSVWIVADWQPELDPLDLLTDVVCHLLGPALDPEPRTKRKR